MNTNLNLLSIGDLARLKMPILGEPAGTLAVVYEHYLIGQSAGVSLITENGVDLGGFSTAEQYTSLERLGTTGMAYQFTNVMNLATDFRRGMFTFKVLGQKNISQE